MEKIYIQSFCRSKTGTGFLFYAVRIMSQNTHLLMNNYILVYDSILFFAYSIH